jgi:hypothetical protein
MVTEYQYSDGSTDFTIPSEGKTAAPGGQLLHLYHYKHFKVMEKRENRGGDAVAGRGIGAVPTAYEITAMTANQDEARQLGLSEDEVRASSTQALSDRVSAQRRDSLGKGTGAGDWRENERLRAEQHGGPYYHTHVGRVEAFRLSAHVRHAHGEELGDGLTASSDLVQRHQELHAALELERTRASRAQDPGYKDPGLGMSDWRDQQVLEVADVPRVPAPSD